MKTEDGCDAFLWCVTCVLSVAVHLLDLLVTLLDYVLCEFALSGRLLYYYASFVCSTSFLFVYSFLFHVFIFRLNAVLCCYFVQMSPCPVT